MASTRSVRFRAPYDAQRAPPVDANPIGDHAHVAAVSNPTHSSHDTAPLQLVRVVRYAGPPPDSPPSTATERLSLMARRTAPPPAGAAPTAFPLKSDAALALVQSSSPPGHTISSALNCGDALGMLAGPDHTASPSHRCSAPPTSEGPKRATAPLAHVAPVVQLAPREHPSRTEPSSDATSTVHPPAPYPPALQVSSPLAKWRTPTSPLGSSSIAK